ncbi:MAG: hypothetical protein IE885_06990 [Campylobacterales bacterium]|nr:hypothetical protein [Campylobacterales bacterium]
MTDRTGMMTGHIITAADTIMAVFGEMDTTIIMDADIMGGIITEEVIMNITATIGLTINLNLTTNLTMIMIVIVIVIIINRTSIIGNMPMIFLLFFHRQVI